MIRKRFPIEDIIGQFHDGQTIGGLPGAPFRVAADLKEMQEHPDDKHSFLRRFEHMGI